MRTVRTTLVAVTAVVLSCVTAAPALARAGNTHDATGEAIEAAVEDGVPGVTAT